MQITNGTSANLVAGSTFIIVTMWATKEGQEIEIKLFALFKGLDDEALEIYCEKKSHKIKLDSVTSIEVRSQESIVDLLDHAIGQWTFRNYGAVFHCIE